MAACPICTETFNKSTHSPITCSSCNLLTCSSCTERYLLSIQDDAKCMHCNSAWSRESLSKCGLSKKFTTHTYKQRREDLLYERQRALFPATQPHVERMIISTKLVSESTEINYQCSLIEREVAVHLNTSVTDYIESQNLDYNEGVIKYYEELGVFRKKIAQLLVDATMKSLQARDILSLPLDTKKAAKSFIRSCPNNECKGFLNHVWHCGMCDKWTCKDCGEIKTDNHTCLKDNVESFKLIKNDSRACPKCASMIFKIDGCDQMWCPQCSTAFSWRTGAVETGRIHNPLYYEYMRHNKIAEREIGDVPCGGMPTRVTVYNHHINSVIRYDAHIEYVYMREYRNDYDPTFDMRVKYMMNSMTEEKFKYELQRYEKKTQKNNDIIGVLNTYRVITADTVRRYATNYDSDEALMQLNNIKMFTNERMAAISKIYNCVVPYVQDDFTLNKNKPVYV